MRPVAATRYIGADWYDSPRFYDLIFDQDSASEADFIEAAWRKHVAGREAGRADRPGGLRILEPACGSGRLMRALASRGHRVAGFDRNETMLGAARAKLAAAGVTGILKRAELEAFAVRGMFDVAHCLLSTFKYILDEEGAAAHLRCVERHLRVGGIYLLGVHLTDYRRTRCEHERWTGNGDGMRVVSNTRTWPPDRAHRRERLRNRLRVRHDGEPGEHCQETLWECRTYSAREMFRLLARIPQLRPVAFYDFRHDINCPQHCARQALRGDVVFVLRRESGC